VERILVFCLPALNGITALIAECSFAGARFSSAPWYCVRTAIMPQPISTPTAAGMIAARVGMTDPTVDPLPR
jgi:hypothetical protein